MYMTTRRFISSTLSVLVCAALVLTTLAADPSAGSVNLQADGVTRALSLNGAAPFHTTVADVQNLRTVAVPGTGTELVLWDENAGQGAATPFFAVSFDGQTVARVTDTSYELKLEHGDFDPLRGVPAPKAGLAAGAGCELYIVQFITQPLDVYRAQIAALGGTVRNFIANHAYIVQMSTATHDAVVALPYVRWVGPLHPAYRLEGLVRDNLARADEFFAHQRYNIEVFESGYNQKHAVAERIRALGGEVNNWDAGKMLVEATLTPAQLLQVITWNEVLFVDRWSPLQPDMNNARAFGGANYIETAGGFRGQGVRGEVFDIGFNLAHVDFQSRPLIEHGGPAGSDSHGASTSGIVFGDGTGNAMGRGMLPLGQGIVANYNNVGLTGVNRYNHTAQLRQSPYYAVFQTCSVGSDLTTQYTTISADMDTMLFDLDIAICQSQSNAGSQSSRPQAWAKNIISVGALYHYDTLATTDDCWCSGGSIGPAADGRIKPDLCAYYDQIFTTTSGSPTAYTTDFGGTSGATPIVAGHVGLVFQMWAAGIFGNLVDPQGTVFSNRCHMTTAKALLINNAWQYAFSGTTGDRIRMHQGWGWPSLQRVYDMRERMFVVNETDLLSNTQRMTYTLTVLPGEPEFRATMVYADPAGTPGSSQHRINDLTLKVTAPGGTIYYGNNGLTAGNYSTPGGNPNTKDTVENVFVQNPAGGVWVVEVIASEINQDSHIETPQMDADFALVVSGVIPCSSAGFITMDRNIYNCAGVVDLRVVDCDLNTDPNAIDTVTVMVTSDSEPAGEPVVLTEIGPTAAVFAGSIPLSATDAMGVLKVANGDTITATYVDADNGQGGTNVVVTDTGSVDCIAATISNVLISDVQRHSAKVSFAASEPVRATVRYGLNCGALTSTVALPDFSTAPLLTLAGLVDNRTYYFVIDAEDQGGNVATADNGGSCFSFTTPKIPNFFTQLFTVGNDLDFHFFDFTPNGTVDFYRGCVMPTSQLPTDPTGGTTLSPGADGYVQVNVLNSQTVKLYGVAYTRFFVGANGYITFNTGDSASAESADAHFNQPRISALFDDLNPTAGGSVSWKQTDDRVAVTWLNVPEQGTSTQNTFQIEMYFTGEIKIGYLSIAAQDGLAGLSRGSGTDPDFASIDLTAIGPCQEFPPQAQNVTASTNEEQAVAITLLGTDDGVPLPPGQLTYIITSLPGHGSLSDPLGGAITAVPYALLNYGKQVSYLGAVDFFGVDTFAFKVNDGGVPPDGGDSNVATVTVTVINQTEIVYNFNLDTDPGWSVQGLWAWGTPTGGGTHNHDPANGHTGNTIYAYNLTGDYVNNRPAYYLTTNALNCQNVTDISLKFWRWLGVEQYDTATVELSTNGTTWTTLWSNAGQTVTDTAWVEQSFDIAAIADLHPTVYLRWGMGPTDNSVSYPGWSIDDIQVWGYGPLPGDLNCNGVVGFDDINPFVLRLSSPAQYLVQYPNCPDVNGDINGNGTVGFDDINPFVALLSHG
jgi:hypothetical protein